MNLKVGGGVGRMSEQDDASTGISLAHTKPADDGNVSGKRKRKADVLEGDFFNSFISLPFPTNIYGGL